VPIGRFWPISFLCTVETLVLSSAANTQGEWLGQKILHCRYHGVFFRYSKTMASETGVQM
jgi:hypothetical protein